MPGTMPRMFADLGRSPWSDLMEPGRSLSNGKRGRAAGIAVARPAFADHIASVTASAAAAGSAWTSRILRVAVSPP